MEKNFTETMLKTRVCVLDGFDGPTDALCHPLKSSDSCSHLIQSIDGSKAIHVGRAVVETRFASSDKPTFYYS